MKVQFNEYFAFAVEKHLRDNLYSKTTDYARSQKRKLIQQTMNQNKEDYYYTDEDIAKLKARANDDRLCRIAYNLYMLYKGDVIKELYKEIIVSLKTEIVDNMRYIPLKPDEEENEDEVKRRKEFTTAYIGLIKNLPAITKGLKALEDKIGMIDKDPKKEEIQNRTAEQMLREKIKNNGLPS